MFLNWHEEIYEATIFLKEFKLYKNNTSEIRWIFEFFSNSFVLFEGSVTTFSRANTFFLDKFHAFKTFFLLYFFSKTWNWNTRNTSFQYVSKSKIFLTNVEIFMNIGHFDVFRSPIVKNPYYMHWFRTFVGKCWYPKK